LGKTVLSADINTEAILTTKESYAFGRVALKPESEPELKAKKDVKLDEQQLTKSAVKSAAKTTARQRAGPDSIKLALCSTFQRNYLIVGVFCSNP
jgi:hypothetical protein